MNIVEREQNAQANARLYDPLLGRLLSPDPYVQAPNFTQNFNRYSYCLNNPLVYVDEDGEFIHLIIGAAIGGVVNVIANWKTIKERGFWTGAGYFGVGAAAGALSAGIGAGISSALVSGGSFSAGFLGTTAAKTAVTSFISGAAIGGGAGGAGGFITGFGNGLLGKKISDNLSGKEHYMDLEVLLPVLQLEEWLVVLVLLGMEETSLMEKAQVILKGLGLFNSNISKT